MTSESEACGDSDDSDRHHAYWFLGKRVCEACFLGSESADEPCSCGDHLTLRCVQCFKLFEQCECGDDVGCA